MRLSVAALAAALAVLACVLSACTDLPGIGSVARVPTPSPSPTATATPTAVSTPAPTPTPTPTPAPSLTLWINDSEPAHDLARALASEFGTQEGISVTVTRKPGDSLRVSLLAAAAAGEPLPDLIWGDQDDLAALVLDAKLQPVGLPLTSPISGTRTRDVGDFLPPAVASATLDGQLWGVPLSAQDMLLLLHNRALAAQPPATTDELIVMSRAFDDSEHAGLVAAWDEAYWLLAWLNGFGGTLTTPDGRQPTLNTPQMVSALNLLRELYRAAPPDQQSYASGRDLFAAGQAALAIDGTWALPAYIGSDTLPDLGIAPLPRVPATGRRAAPPVSIAYLMLPHTLAGERLDRAQAFASYLVAPAAQERMAMTLQRLPTVREVLGIPAVTNDRVLSVAAIQAESAFGVPPTQAARCALLGINMQLEAVLEEDADQQEIAEAMQQDAKLCLEL